jgi:hypothetical protein
MQLATAAMTVVLIGSAYAFAPAKAGETSVPAEAREQLDKAKKARPEEASAFESYVRQP